MLNGWVKKHRKVMNHWIYQDDRVFSRYEAFDYLIMMVNHQDKKTMFDGQLMMVERGSMVTSIRKLCEKWKWSNTKVNRFLDDLERDEMIVRKSDTKKTVITIVNYDKFQGLDDEETTAKRQQNDTKTLQKHTNKNVKNVKNLKREYAPSVLLTETEYSKLVTKYGSEETLIKWLEFLSNKIQANGYKYKSHYQVMVGWVFDAFEKQQEQPYRQSYKVIPNLPLVKLTKEEEEHLARVYAARGIEH